MEQIKSPSYSTSSLLTEEEEASSTATPTANHPSNISCDHDDKLSVTMSTHHDTNIVVQVDLFQKHILDEAMKRVKKEEEDKPSLRHPIIMDTFQNQDNHHVLSPNQQQQQQQQQQSIIEMAQQMVQEMEIKYTSIIIPQYEYQWEQIQKQNQILHNKISGLQHQWKQQDNQYKENEKQFYMEQRKWKQTLETLEDMLERMRSNHQTQIQELEHQYKTASHESGNLRISFVQMERDHDHWKTLSYQNEKELIKLRTKLQEQNEIIIKERNEYNQQNQIMEDLKKQLMEKESQLQVSNRTGNFLKEKLIEYEVQKATRVPLVAKNAVLKKQLQEKQQQLDDRNIKCVIQAKRLETLEEKLDSYEKEVMALPATIATCKVNEESFLQDMTHLRSRLGSSEADNQTLRNIISDLESQLSTIKKKADIAQCKLQEYEERKIKMEIETKEQCDKYERQMKETWSRADLLEFQLAETEANAHGKISELETNLNTALSQVMSLEGELVHVNEQRITADDTHMNRIKDLEYQLKQTRDDLSTLTDNALIAATDAMEEQHNFQKMVSEFEISLAACKVQLEKAEEEIERRKAQLLSNESNSSHRIEVLQNELKANTQLIHDLKVSLAESEAKNQDLQSQLNTLQARLVDSAGVVKMLTDQITEIRYTSHEEIGALKSNMDDMSHKLTETQSLLKEAKQELANKTHHILDLESHLPIINRKVYCLESEVNYAKEEVVLCKNKLKHQTDDFQNQLAIEKNQNDMLQADTILQAENIKQLETSLAKMQSNSDEKGNLLHSAHRTIGEQERKISELVATIAELEFQLDESDRVIDSLRTSLSEVKSNHQSQGEATKSHILQTKCLAADYEREITMLREKMFILQEDRLRNMEHVRLLEAGFV